MKYKIFNSILLLICVTLSSCSNNPTSKETFSITWNNYDGNPLKIETLPYGSIPNYTGGTPTKPQDAQYTYTFSGWDKPITIVTGPQTYTAQFSNIIKSYQVIWKNYDGKVLQDRKHNYGETPTYTGDTPTKPQDTQYTYTFSGWDKPITIVTGPQTYTAQFTSSVSIPIIDIKGDMSGISKDNPVNVEATYLDNNQKFTKFATLKYQGDSSMSYNKKNYTIKFENKVTLINSWGKEKKYCLKANYIDYSQARNVVSAKIYGQIGRTRNTKDEYSNLVNCGAIDGYPIVLNINGEFHGLYTLNIPKDEWLYKMSGDSEKQAIIMGRMHTATPQLLEKISNNYTYVNQTINDMRLEYNSKEKSDFSWIAESFNKIIDFLLKVTTAAEFNSSIGNYINVNRTIDTMLFSQFIEAIDNRDKNILWTTFDGNHWTPNIYDLDSTWGLHWLGTEYFDPADWLPDESKNSNNLWKKLYEFSFDKIKNRYKEIRDKVLNLDNILKTFNDFFKYIPDNVRDAETKKWPGVPSKDTNNIKQILNFSKIRLELFDKYFL